MTDKNQLISEEQAKYEALNEKLIDAMTPGFQAEFDPEEAETVGAFVEDALSEEDATESDVDLLSVKSEDNSVYGHSMIIGPTSSASLSISLLKNKEGD